MGSYNWLDFPAHCPACRTIATVRAQTHVASDYGAGDEDGRFHDRTYRLGIPMAWLPPSHRKYDTWREKCDSSHTSPPQEACYSSCLSCNAELCAVVEFDNRIAAVRIVHLSLEADWPEGYWR